MSDVFISRATADSDFAEKIAARLSASGLTVWNSRELRPGEAWPEQISRAIDEAKDVLVVISEDATRSQWLTTEVAIALARSGKRIIPILRTSPKNMPFILRDRQGIDFSERSKYEPALDRLVAVLKDTTSAPIEPDSAFRARVLEKESLQLHLEVGRYGIITVLLSSTITAVFVGTVILSFFMVILVALALVFMLSRDLKTPATTSLFYIAAASAIAAALGAVIAALAYRRVRQRLESDATGTQIEEPAK